MIDRYNNEPSNHWCILQPQKEWKKNRPYYDTSVNVCINKKKQKERNIIFATSLFFISRRQFIIISNHVYVEKC